MGAGHLPADRRTVADMIFGLTGGDLFGFGVNTRICKAANSQHSKKIANRFIVASVS
jgi:poly(A) polymerase Pap1